MANEIKNQEFNRAIKQLQSMVKDKVIINLAEKFYHLKTEMTGLTRSAKDKEVSLLLEETKAKAVKPDVEVVTKTEVAEKPKVDTTPVQPKEQVAQKPFVDRPNKTQNIQQQNNFRNNYNNRNNNPNNKFQNANYRNNQNGAYNNQNGQRRPFNQNNRPGQPYQNRPNQGQNGFRQNPNFKPGQKPPFNKDNQNKRPAINYAQPIITASPTRSFANKKKDGERYEEKRQYSKRDLLKRGMIEDGNEDRILNRKLRTKKKDTPVQVVERPQGPAIITTDNITIKILSEASGKPVSEIIKKFMLLGMMVTINSTIDFGTAELVMSDMGIELQQKLDKTSEEKLLDLQTNLRSYDEADAVTRPPIVTVMGHVDHGKTSLLDYIRKTKVTTAEAGGITQAIGAYKVQVENKSITFIDTPGHEAFTAMRARGASVTDIAILIVAADDGIMPQTVEAINHIKSANIPMIVAINKMDKLQADPDRVMQQLAEHNVLPEAWGGDAIICKISAHTGEGIDKLLETILLIADVQDLKANPNIPAMGTLLEARLDKGKGAIASLIVRDGSLHIGDTIVSGTSICKIKAMIDENNKQVKVATPSMPVTVLGFNEVPNAGETFTAVDEKLSKQIVEERKAKQKEELIKGSGGNTLEDLMQKTSEKDMKILNIVLKTDVHGSLEAIKASVMKLVNDEVKINILHSGVGAISESDLILANASNAMLIAFNIGQDSKVKTLAERMKMKIYSYKIIYELLDEIERVVKGMKEPKYEEVYLGRAECLAVFKLSNAGIVAGCMVRDGKIVRGEHVRIYRGDEIIATTEIKSLKVVKDDVKEVGKDRECGIKTPFDEIQAGDRIECYTLKRIEE
ncbi:MAG: translation initiation factor IF-2 [Clostridia bacterium]|nr:translation initiation factor IF-2 [Clostridia bacterium]